MSEFETIWRCPECGKKMWAITSPHGWMGLECPSFKWECKLMPALWGGYRTMADLEKAYKGLLK